MDYSVKHATRFQYQGPVNESVMEVRLCPRSGEPSGGARVRSSNDACGNCFRYVDAFGNRVHHFDIIAAHDELLVEARMQVRTMVATDLPERLEPSAWDTLADLRANGELWDFFAPSPRVPVSAIVSAFADSQGIARTQDPLTSVRRIVSAVNRALIYAPNTTTVDTPIEAVLETRRGVCQDFAHVTLAIARRHGIPCRYVSGYLAPERTAAGGTEPDQPRVDRGVVTGPRMDGV